MERYGVYHHLQSPEILAKQKETFYKNGTCITSKQQEYIFNLYKSTNEDVALNFPISYCNADICFSKEKLEIEYDGSGHDLNVRLGNMTQEEFNQKEIIRNSVIKHEGYKQMRIISSKDKLPSDTILFQMLSDARTYFSTTQHTWIEFSIDNKTIRSAEHHVPEDIKQVIPYNYGELRTIKDSDLQS